MARRKLLKSKLKVFHGIGILESDYQRILKEDRVTQKGIAVIVTEALNQYLVPSGTKQYYKNVND